MKKQVFLYTLVLFLAGMLTLVSFQLPDSILQKDIPLLVRQKLDEEVRKYYADRMLICRYEALQRAEDYVDSVIVNRINLNILNGLNFPVRPPRPDSPASIFLDDTTKIGPFIFK
ncbi:MAG: hypothetical protein IPN29_04550 [Saprospiraceae bacterium]|nr:hypothetical protein [Saprospiraceae bacterium]